MDTLYIYIIFGILILIILVLLRLALLNWVRRKRSAHKMKVGRRMESKAKKVLSKQGFKKIRYQEKVYYKLLVDGKEVKILCIPDFIAERKDKQCVIEVKWGASAPFISNSATRRQLLEYQHALQPDALYLLDMGTRSMKQITF